MILKFQTGKETFRIFSDCVQVSYSNKSFQNPLKNHKSILDFETSIKDQVDFIHQEYFDEADQGHVTNEEISYLISGQSFIYYCFGKDKDDQLFRRFEFTDKSKQPGVCTVIYTSLHAYICQNSGKSIDILR